MFKFLRKFFIGNKHIEKPTPEAVRKFIAKELGIQEVLLTDDMPITDASLGWSCRRKFGNQAFVYPNTTVSEFTKQLLRPDGVGKEEEL